MQEHELFSVLTGGRAAPPVETQMRVRESAISLQKYQNLDLQVFSYQVGNKTNGNSKAPLSGLKRKKKFSQFLYFNYKHDLIYSGYFPNVSNVSNAT